RYGRGRYREAVAGSRDRTPGGGPNGIPSVTVGEPRRARTILRSVGRDRGDPAAPVTTTHDDNRRHDQRTRRPVVEGQGADGDGPGAGPALGGRAVDGARTHRPGHRLRRPLEPTPAPADAQPAGHSGGAPPPPGP